RNFTALRITLASPMTIGRHNSCTCGRDSALTQISGPIPAGSPMLMPMMGLSGISIQQRKDHEALAPEYRRHGLETRATPCLDARSAEGASCDRTSLASPAAPSTPPD